MPTIQINQRNVSNLRIYSWWKNKCELEKRASTINPLDIGCRRLQHIQFFSILQESSVIRILLLYKPDWIASRHGHLNLTAMSLKDKSHIKTKQPRPLAYLSSQWFWSHAVKQSSAKAFLSCPFMWWSSKFVIPSVRHIQISSKAELQKIFLIIYLQAIAEHSPCLTPSIIDTGNSLLLMKLKLFLIHNIIFYNIL